MLPEISVSYLVLACSCALCWCRVCDSLLLECVGVCRHCACLGSSLSCPCTHAVLARVGDISQVTLCMSSLACASHSVVA
jgi:hypothetical protein